MRIDRWRRLQLTRSVMSTDDEVAPGTSRRAGGHILAIGLLLVVVASLLLFETIQARSDKAIHSAGLNQKEITQLRDFLAQRNQQRDEQQQEFQRQLDQQARILCLAISDFKSRAHSASTVKTLDQAMKSLKCAKVIKEAASPDTYTRTKIPTTSPTSVPRAVGTDDQRIVPRATTRTTTKTQTKTVTPTTQPQPQPLPSIPTEPLPKPLCEIVPLLCI